MYGGGDWEQICECFTFAGSKLYDDNGNLISEANRTYKADGVVRGEFEHKLTVNEMPSHDHTLAKGNIDTSSSMSFAKNDGYLNTIVNTAGKYWWTRTTYSGGSQPHNNMPPYQVGYKWKRVG